MPDKTPTPKKTGTSKTPVESGKGSPDTWFSVIPMRDMVIFPGTAIPLLLGRPGTLAAMFKTMETPQRLAFFALQKNAADEEVDLERIHRIGVIGRILESSQAPGQLSRIMVAPLYPAAAYESKMEGMVLEVKALQHLAKFSGHDARLVEAAYARFAEHAEQSPEIPAEFLAAVSAQKDPELKIYLAASQLKIPAGLKQMVLEAQSLSEKARLFSEFIKNELEMNVLHRQLEYEVKTSISRAQKEFFLNEQLRKIRAELGSQAHRANPELQKLEEDAKSCTMPDSAREKVLAEIGRLDLLHPTSPEYSVVRNYIDTIMSLPWNIFTEDTRDLRRVRRQLDAGHFGLKKIKDRILEHLAVFKLAGRDRGPILCLSGPPGVGKTSLGQSIADALNRKFIRISLGGIHDEAEIRGHRKTYIGSMPGKIVQLLRKCRAMNPVILLDEVDKMGKDFRGDPASALLELLDPEQNHDFSDHFLEIGIDLSRAFFITTANIEMEIPGSLRDRMEIIRIPGYPLHEKKEIALRHLVPKCRERSGLKPVQLQLSENTVIAIIRRYTREAGVRGLEKAISAIARKRARAVVQGGQRLKPVSESSLSSYLGAPVRKESGLPVSCAPGNITGLAWTASGGETLRVECKLLSGRGRLQLTGKMGDVMRESGQIALTLVREHLKNFKINPEIARRTDVHLHIPEGAVPKDGPSAGVAMTLAIMSAFLRQKVKPVLAFTGEVSLAGTVLAVGGVYEKVLAALQVGVKEVMLPAENLHEIAEIPAGIRKQIRLRKVGNIDTVFKLVFKKP